MGETRLTESLRTAGRQMEISTEDRDGLKVTIDGAVKRSLDEALRAACVSVSAVKEPAGR